MNAAGKGAGRRLPVTAADPVSAVARELRLPVRRRVKRLS